MFGQLLKDAYTVTTVNGGSITIEWINDRGNEISSWWSESDQDWEQPRWQEAIVDTREI